MTSRPSGERWARILSLLDELLDLPDDRRSARLEAIGREDPEARVELERLLEVDRKAGDSLERRFAAEAADLLDTLESDSMGEGPRSDPGARRVGPYRIVREAGRGGMGVVYLAERADGQFEQVVALKILPRGIESPEALGRFRRERQILARLVHPNIARLLDGGVTEDARPWFTMEFVEGTPITSWCDDQKLSIHDRLRLFDTVCEAVAFAHRNLIIHRDLKPSNILIAKDGKVKLLDFGIARILSEDAGADAVTLTRPATGPLTPQYAAPEQVRGEPATTATDVYGLGLVLYELLAGRRPYSVQDGSRAEMERAVLESEPMPPSFAATRRREASGSRPGESAETARRRGTTAERLGRLLKGDLDTITLTALRKEPALRYATVEALRDDLRRHLENVPIQARRIGPWRRLGKFVGRHRAASGAAAVILVMAAAWLITLAVSVERTRVERERAVKIRGFLEEMLTAAGPQRLAKDLRTVGSADPDTRVRDLLDGARRTLASGLEDDPAVRASIEQTIGETYMALGLYSEAEPLLHSALETNETLDDRSALSESLVTLATLLERAGRPAEALDALNRALDVVTQDKGKDSVDAAVILLNRCSVLHLLGRYEEEAGDAEKAYDLLVRQSRGDPPVVIQALAELAVVRNAQGKLEEAESLQRRVLARARQAYGNDHNITALALSNLAKQLYDQKRWEECISLYRESLEIRRRMHGEDHPEVATTDNSLAMALRNAGRLDEAEPLFREALAIRSKILGPEHRDVLVTQSGLANLLRMRGSYAEAESTHKRILEIRRRTMGSDHPLVASSLSGLAETLTAQHKYAEAEPLLQEALGIRRKKLPAGNADIAQSEAALAKLYQAWGRPAPPAGDTPQTVLH